MLLRDLLRKFRLWFQTDLNPIIGQVNAHFLNLTEDRWGRRTSQTIPELGKERKIGDIKIMPAKNTGITELILNYLKIKNS